MSKSVFVLLGILFLNAGVRAACPTTYADTDISGGDLTNVLGQVGDCCGICEGTGGCAAYTWNNYNGGTCWLKSTTGPLVGASGVTCGIVSGGGSGTYTLTRAYEGSGFFDAWNFATYDDPTHGTVDYVDRNTAQNMGLISVNNNKVRIAADSSNTYPSGRGRPSVRIESTDVYNDGLFIFDLDHMPTGPGTWPAYWMVGPSWPNNGEADILEGVDGLTQDATTLHTSAGCDMSGESTGLFTGAWGAGTAGNPSSNCDINAPNQYSNQGCSIVGPVGTFGPGFNGAGGGIFAFEWDRNGFMRGWIWNHGNAPGDINSANPNPAGWGTPMSYFTLGSNCPASHFNNMQIVINLTFCGDWAGSVYPGGGGACDSEVRNDPGAYGEAYWTINYVKVYHN